MSDEPIDQPPAGPDEWRDLWTRSGRFSVAPPRKGGPAGVVRGIVRRASAVEEERQRNFNVVLLELLSGLRSDIEAVQREAREDLAAARRDARQDLEALQRDLSAELEKVRELVFTGVRRNDALAAALDQKIESLAVRVRDVTNPIVNAAGSNTTSDFLYRRLEDGLRGSEEEIGAAVASYVELAREHQPVVDAGCGRGEFLVACKAAGIDAKGFDTNERSVSDLCARGIDAEIAAIPQCFTRYADASLGSILAMHVVEHLPVDDLFALFREAARTLRSGGLLMIETPNAESLLVSGSEFWRDPTHLAPRHPAALTLLAREYGFDIDRIAAIHPFPEGTRIATAPDDSPSLQRIVAAINERLFGPQDLVLIARKR